MNSNPQHQPPLVDRSLGAQGNSQSFVVEMERLHELQRQVAMQEQRLRSLRQQVADSSDSRVPSTAEQDGMKSLILTKESELATALVKVAELTSQLERLRRTCADESRSSQKTTETKSQPKAFVQRIIPIRIVQEDVRVCRESKKVSRHDSDTKPTAEGNETIRVIPIVLKKPAQISEPLTASAGQQPQGSTLTENAVISQRYAIQTDKKSLADDRGIGRNGKTTEMKERTRYFDANENVKGNDKKFTIFSADTKDSYTGNCIAGSGVRPCDSAAGKEAVERLGETNYSCEMVEKVNVDVAGFDGKMNVENKIEDASDMRKISGFIDKLVDAKTVNIRDDVGSKLQNARGAVVKDRRNAVGRSHSVSDRTDNARRSFDEQKKDFVVGETSHNISPNNSADDRNEENKMKAFSQDKKSLSDFSLSNQLLGLSKGSFDADGWCTKSTVTCTDLASKSAQSQPLSGHGRAAETGFKTDRARFFMDMVKEDVVETGVVQPWKELQRKPVSGEFKKSVSPVVSPSTSVSRGRSSSSAIMSRFAPQPYGRSKSMDSGGLRVPMATLSGTAQTPKVMAGVVDTVSSDDADSGDTVSVSMTSSYDRPSRKLYSPAAIPESRTQVETNVSSSRTVPYSLPFKNSTTSSDSLCQPKSALMHVSLTEEKANVRSISSPSGTLSSDSRPSMTEICRSKTTSASVLSGDTVGYSMPASGRPIPVTSSSTSADKLPSTTEPSSSVSEPSSSVSPAISGAMKKTSDHTMSPVVSVPRGMTKSLYAKSSLASHDEQIATLLQNAKSSSVHASSQNTTVPLKLNSLPEHCSPAVNLTHTASSLIKPSSSLSDATTAKGGNECSSTVVKSEEEFSNTAWDSNVKRLAHIYAVTIGGTVQGRTIVPRDRNKDLNASHRVDGNIKAPLFSEEWINTSGSRTPSCSSDKKNSGELDCVKSLSGPTSCKVPEQDTLSGTASPTVRRKESTDSSSIAEQSSEAVSSTEQLKIDTSADSVSSALSVLLKSNSSAHSSPVRPSRLRTNISSAYRRKLGNGTMDNYSQNMTLLYGDRLASKEGSDVQELASDEIKHSPLHQEMPLIEDLPHILALDTLDGMPICPRLSSHLKDTHDFSVGVVSSRTTDGWRNESFKSGDVGLTVISSPKQTADLVLLDSADGRRNSTDSFNPSDDVVESYVDDLAASDESRVASEMAAQSRVHLFNGGSGKSRRRVTFDHVSLLLNAALEGEKDLVIDVLNKSANPNHKTETGLSALHNAVCGNHIDILKYLVEYGCDVNVEDNDGWTPMHCAASTNNVEMLRILVENGASVLPMTISDRETPVQKCSHNLPAYEEAVRYLTDAANVLGVANDRWVYVTSNFTNVCSDELILCAGERLKILRRGDENESEWWWAKNGEAEGYAPQSLLALYPRIQPKWLK